MWILLSVEAKNKNHILRLEKKNLICTQLVNKSRKPIVYTKVNVQYAYLRSLKNLKKLIFIHCKFKIL